MPCSDPGAFAFGQLLEPTELLPVGPDDQVLSRGCTAGVNPSLPDPVVDLLRNDVELPSQVRNPPFILPDKVVAKQFSHKAQGTHQRSDSTRCENATTARWNETLVVEFLGDLGEVKSLLMKLCDLLREALITLQLLISPDWSSELVLCRNATVPNNRHLV